MGSWDCYCMLCCGPLRVSSVKVGDSEAKALKRRDKVVRRQMREEKSLDGVPGGDEMESTDEDDANAPELAQCPSDSNVQSELYHGNPAIAMYNYYEDYSYDPRLLTKKDVAWLERCRTLGFNPDTNRAYVSGLGKYYDWGDFETSETGTDPNDPQPEAGRGYPCYTPGGGDINDPTFPFHEACYEILAKRLDYKCPADINKDALYEVVRALGEGNGDSLMLDYGGEFSNQFWENRPGEEYVVTCPEDGDLELRYTAWKHLPQSLLLAPPPTDLSPHVRHDAFTILPFDILHTILRYLPVHDSLNLMQASYHVCTTTRESTFWRSMIHTRLAPWFWEIEYLVDGNEIPDLGYKGLFLWLDKVTEPKLGMKGLFMGVANRRRISRVCGLLVDSYKAQLNQRPETEA